ncbi:hypothetical protein I4F81_007712 [Pyropia yezoensis]|uniref:Uncharacterized protein n=1 Tax=Pyropia yezoensis TaxID=2788 RepID=A0ACC3C4U1_PYRYE|nr:hypothetical protein I4F81_007712 [Neopyropia yezoensis]
MARRGQPDQSMTCTRMRGVAALLLGALLAVVPAAAAAATAAVAADASVAAPPPAACEVDYALSVDESGSIRAAQFDTVRRFVGDIVTTAAARSAAARFSITTFARHARVLVPPVTAAAAAAAMDTHRQSRGGTDIAAALTVAAGTLTADADAAVPAGPTATRGRVLILISDGGSAVDPARRAAAAVKAAGITIVTVAVGRRAAVDLLAELASDPRLVFVGEVSDLVSLVDGLVQDTCAVVAQSSPTPSPTPTPTPPPTPAPSPLPTAAALNRCGRTNFPSFHRGAAVRSGPGWTLKVTRGAGAAGAAATAPDVSAAFNSSSPPAWDTDLGTPGACGGGPGVGAGGAPGTAGANCVDRGVVVVASAAADVAADRAACAAACGPGATDGAAACAAACPGNDFGGGATFLLRFPGGRAVTITAVTVLDVDTDESVAVGVVAPDAVNGKGPDTVTVAGAGENGIQTLRLGLVIAPGGGVRVRCGGSCALVEVAWC